MLAEVHFVIEAGVMWLYPLNQEYVFLFSNDHGGGFSFFPFVANYQYFTLFHKLYYCVLGMHFISHSRHPLVNLEIYEQILKTCQIRHPEH